MGSGAKETERKRERKRVGRKADSVQLGPRADLSNVFPGEMRESERRRMQCTRKRACFLGLFSSQFWVCSVGKVGSLTLWFPAPPPLDHVP